MSSHMAEILIVDDSPAICATIAKFLGDEYTTHLAANGEEGWELLQSNQSISLVFSDMHMPILNGMLLLQKIRNSECERIANIPVIMITGHEDTESAKKATHNLGATDFLSKPFDKIDIVSRAKAYSSLNNKITELEKEAAYDAQTGLYSNNMLLDFGNKTISFALRHDMAASILYLEIAAIDKYREAHGDKATKTIVSTVAGLLESSLRREELVSHIKEARFAIVLPNTKAFKAHIVATRLKQAVEDLTFEISNIKIRVSLAIGLFSTEDFSKSESLTFEEYCAHASHALAASLDTPNKQITTYDETYEKKIDVEKGCYTSSTPEITDTVDDEQDSTDAFGDFFSSIMTGDYSNIPVEFLPSLIEPLEKFLEYAHATVNDDQKISGE